MIDRVLERFIAPRPTISRIRYRADVRREETSFSSTKTKNKNGIGFRACLLPYKSIGLETVGRSAELYPRKVSFRGKRWHGGYPIPLSRPVCEFHRGEITVRRNSAVPFQRPSSFATLFSLLFFVKHVSKGRGIIRMTVGRNETALRRLCICIYIYIHVSLKIKMAFIVPPRLCPVERRD